MVRGKKILLGVTGGIAVYKAAELARELIKNGAEVKTIMTRAATEFVTPLTFQTLTNNPVMVDMFEKPVTWEIEHIALAKWADAFLIAPATANMIGKVASGIADDMLTTSVMATTAPVVFAPSMNVNMYQNKIVQRNIQILKDYGYLFIQPEVGELACGDVGQGRLADIHMIASFVESLFTKKDFLHKKIVITAGPTRESIDPVRFISNNSSGKMGYALAKASKDRGADVVLITGPTSIDPPEGVTYKRVNTALEMKAAILDNYQSCDIVIMAAAVADYRPAVYNAKKIKKKEESITLSLERNPDILKELGAKKKNQILVGFAAETDNVIPNALKKLREKNLDMIVINDVTMQGAGFDVDTNIVKIINKDGNVKEYPIMKKIDVAHTILDVIQSLMVR